MGWLFALVLLALAPAQASAAWQPIGNLSPASVDVTQPDVAAAANGREFAVWRRSDGFTDRAQFAIHAPGASWGGIAYASDPGTVIAEPHVALDADGDATFVWLRFDGSNWVVETRTRSAAGGFTSVQRLSGPGEDATDPHVGVTPGGDAVFAWLRSDGANDRVQTRTRSAAGTLGSANTLSPAGRDALALDLAVDPSGGAWVVWKRSNGSHVRAEARRRAADGTIDPILTISGATAEADGPDVGVESDGTGVFTWTEFDGSHWIVRSRTVSPAGVMSPDQALGPGGRDSLEPQVAVDADGNSKVVWRRFDGTYWRIQIQPLAPDGSLDGARQGLSGPGDSFEPRVAVDSNGVTVVVWRQSNGAHDVTVARERSADGSLPTGPRTLSDGTQDARDPRVAMAPNGEAVLLWRPTGGQNGFGLDYQNRSAGGQYTKTSKLWSGFLSAREGQVAASADGEAIFAWRRLDAQGWILEARRRFADGTLGPIVRLGDAELDDAHLRVAVDPNGNALFVWELPTPNDVYPGVVSRAWPAGGAVGPQQALFSDARRPELAMDASGNATIVAETLTDRTRAVTRTRSAAGALSSTTVLSAPSDFPTQPQVGVAADGRAVFAWDSYTAPGDEPISARTRAVDGTFTPIVPVSPLGISNQPAVSVGADGRALIVWERNTDGGGRLVEGRSIDTVGSLGPPRSLSDPSTIAFHPRVAVLSSGAGIFAWMNTSTSNNSRWVQSRLITTSDSLGTLRDASDPNGFADGDLALAATPDGGAAIAWARFFAPFKKQVETRSASSTGTLGAVTGLSDPARDAGGPMLAGGGGNAYAIWGTTDGQTPRVQGAVGP